MATTLHSPAARDQLLQWWQLRSRGERALLASAAGLAIAAIAWLLVWQPLSRDSPRLERQLAAQRLTLAEARRQADAMVGLARATPAPISRDARSEVDAALTRQGLKAAASAIERTDDQRVRITFDSIAFDALTMLLEALQRDAKLRALDLSAAARVEPGLVRAEVTLGP